MTHILQKDAFRLIAFNKCGHKSIVRSFSQAPGGQSLDGVKRTGLGSKRMNRDLPNALVTAAFIRHPFARLASVYNHLFTVRSGYPIIFGTDFTEDMSFPDFCKGVVALVDPNTIDFHIRPQMVCFLQCVEQMGQTRFSTQHFYKLDGLRRRWSEMCFLYDLKCTRQVHWENDRSDAYPVPWTQMFHEVNDPTMDALRDLYLADLKAWSAAD